MDHYSILDQASPPPGSPAVVPSAGTVRSAGISSQIAAANAKLHDLPQNATVQTGLPAIPPRFPGEDSGRSLAEMAQDDLDAALHLLAERALYITGASGAAIALRRSQQNDMLCRASVGSNAPELGSLLSMEYGLSGESVRTRQPLRCTDAERDPRVNRDVCRELGIASVVVMPIIGEDLGGNTDGHSVLGVFELFSGETNAFNERDLSALTRLGQMVETAMRHAAAVEVAPHLSAHVETPILPSLKMSSPVALPPNPLPPEAGEQVQASRAASSTSTSVGTASAGRAAVKDESQPIAPQKPLFWSAAMRTQTAGQGKEESSATPATQVLKNLQKCQTCGFPVSPGRSLCVECEEKRWRGPRGQASASPVQIPNKAPTPEPKAVAEVSQEAHAQKAASPVKETDIRESEPEPERESKQEKFVRYAAPSTVAAEANAASASPAVPSIQPAPIADAKSNSDLNAAASESTLSTSTASPVETAPFLSSALPAESWLAANKYILIVLLLVAAIIGSVVWLR